MNELIAVITLIWLIFIIYFMVKLLKNTKEQRILTSVLLQVVRDIAEKQGVEVDLNKMINETIKRNN